MVVLVNDYKLFLKRSNYPISKKQLMRQGLPVGTYYKSCNNQSKHLKLFIKNNHQLLLAMKAAYARALRANM